MQEETDEGMKRNLEEVSQESNALKTKVLKLEGDLLEKMTVMKAMNLHFGRFEEQNWKLSVENECLCDTREEVISLLLNRLPPKHPPRLQKSFQKTLNLNTLVLLFMWNRFSVCGESKR